MPYYLLREDELAVKKETTYATSPGAAAAGDFFKHTSSHVGITHQLEERPRDQDRDNAQASVLTLLTGRESAQVSIEADIIPSGVTGTPTAPDTDVLWEILMGTKNTRTAHTTTVAGSTTTVVNLALGGVAASGIAVGDLIAVDVSASVGLEVRQVTSITGDNVTVDRALSAAPAASRDVRVGTTFLLNQAQLLSAYLWLFNGANKWAVPGLILQEGDVRFNFADTVPIGRVRFSGLGQTETTHTDTRPTPTTQGTPLVPSVGKVWLGATKYPIISAGFNVKNGLELRNTESDALKPSAVKRTGNNSRYLVEQTIELYLQDTTKSFYDNARTRTVIDAICQMGNAVGKIIAWRTPVWQSRADRTEQDGEVGLNLTGRCFGSAGDDEIRVAFL